MSNKAKPKDYLDLLPIFYISRMVANICNFSSRAGKLVQVVGSWQRLALGKEYQPARQASEFLARIPGRVADMHGSDDIPYQAGIDLHIKDMLCGFLPTNQRRERDSLVFVKANSHGIASIGSGASIC